MIDTFPETTNSSSSKRYRLVYAEDIATNHAPVLDWQSGLENLEQLHTEPVKQKPKKEENCGCCVISENIEGDLNSIIEVLDKLSLSDISEQIKRFLKSKNTSNLLEAIQASENKDLVSNYRLKKIAEKLLEEKKDI